MDTIWGQASAPFPQAHKFIENPSDGKQLRSQFAGSIFVRHAGDDDSNSGNGPEDNEEAAAV